MREFLRVTVPVFAAGALAFWWAGRRVQPAVRRARWIKFATYVVIVHGVLFASILGRAAVVSTVVAIAAAGSVEIVAASRRVRRGIWIPIVFAVIAAAAIGFASTMLPLLVGYVYLVVAAFDGFSQAGGQLAGRRRLAPAVSPGKTVEGLAIGAAGAGLCGWLLRGAVQLSVPDALRLAAVASGAGLAGDLAASWVKRRANLKDYSAMLPGHGGVLDRFDSFLAVAAVLFVLSVFR
jgi:phosphatidate cytidylyltransferase